MCFLWIDVIILFNGLHLKFLIYHVFRCDIVISIIDLYNLSLVPRFYFYKLVFKSIAV